MTMMGRRGFMKFLPAAIVSAPVAAKEAAAKMGLQGVIGSIGTASRLGGGECGSVPCSPVDEASWIKDRLVTWASADKRAELRFYERNGARLLDGDLAAMRSISPSFAFTKQLDRNLDRLIDHETSGLRKQLKKLGIPFI